MKDAEGVQFLQWCLPRLGLRWTGFRKVRRQVYKRIDRRLATLGLPDLSAYRAYLETQPPEWATLDALCRISISRFYRDSSVFEYLGGDVLPALATAVAAQGRDTLSCWSIGCAAGEEPYTLAILWQCRLAARFPGLRLAILATDADAGAIARAGKASYPASSVRGLPAGLVARAFARETKGFHLREEFRRGVTFEEQDIRQMGPDRTFDLILCRNLAFTYFDEDMQRAILYRLSSRLAPRGAIVIGRRERLPDGVPGFEAWSAPLGIYRRSAED